MASLTDFSLPTRLLLKAYQWRKIEPVPWAPLRKPLAQCRLGLVSTAGFVRPEQPRFNSLILGGDTSFREIPNDTDPRTLIDAHRSESFDHSGLALDANLVFPITRANELAASGRVQSVNHRHFSFMGSIVAPGRLTRDTAPEAARRFVEDGVDVALLVPV